MKKIMCIGMALSFTVGVQAQEGEKAQDESAEAVVFEISLETLTESNLTTDFYFTNIGFYSKRRHWDNPSTFTLNSDGSWFFYTKRFANFDRTWADTGRTWRARADITFYTVYNAGTKKCEGQLLHSNQYRFATVRYKEQKHNFTRRGDDPEYAKISGQARCASMVRWWYN